MDVRRAGQVGRRLARRLTGAGAGPERVVAVAVDRSALMVATVLAVLKAGAAYLPVDPGYPAERVAFMLADACPALVVTTAEVAARLPDGGPARVQADDPAVQTDVTGGPATGSGPGVLVDGRHPAYVIYTSGSTGAPKGVVVTHRSAAGLVDRAGQKFGLGRSDAWTLFHSYAFDFSVWEMWGALAHGGRLVVVPYAVTRSPGEFLELLSEAGVTVVSQTPSAFYQLARAERDSGAAGARGTGARVALCGAGRGGAGSGAAGSVV